MRIDIFRQYASATSDNLKLAGTGTGDIAEMTESLADDEAAYAYVRMKLGNDEYSERVKFAFVVWAGQLPFPHITLLYYFSLTYDLRAKHQSHAQSQNELPVWTGQAGYPDVCS
jgi:hypothetical protein